MQCHGRFGLLEDSSISCFKHAVGNNRITILLGHATSGGAGKERISIDSAG